MDTITGALTARDTLNVEYVVHPETQISKVVGLQTELAKAITDLTISGGTITITKGNGTTSTITIATGTSGAINVATTTSDGLLSAADKTKLDGIETGAQKNSTALATTTSNGLMSKEDKTNLNNLTAGTVTGVKGNAESSYRAGNVNITAENIGAASTNIATTSTNGLMSKEDKSKLNGIDENANNYSHPTGAGYEHLPTDSESAYGSRTIYPQYLKFKENGKGVWDIAPVYCGNFDINNMPVRGFLFGEQVQNCPYWTGSAIAFETRGCAVINNGSTTVAFPERQNYIFLKPYGSSNWLKLAFA